MPFLFAFWTLDVHGRPDPESADPWGEPNPLDALDDYDRDTVGPFLTVFDDDAETVLYAGDATDALRSFAADTSGRTGWGPDPALGPVDQALDACRALAALATDEAAREAIGDWREPDPDTWRTGPLPCSVRRSIRHGAEAVGHQDAGDALAAHLLAAVLPARIAA